MEKTYKELHPTGKKILEAATKIFTKKGYKGATTSEIAREAGVAEGTIFKHFKSKKELFLSLFIPFLIQMAETEVVDSLEKLLEAKKDEPEEQVLKAIFHNRLNLIRKNKHILKLLFYEAQFHEEIRELFINKIAVKVRKVMMDYIEERKKAGRFKDIDSGVAARSLAFSFVAHIFWYDFVSQYAHLEEDIDKEKDLNELIKLFLYGMASD